MKIISFLTFLLLPFYALCQANQPVHFKIYNTKTQQVSSLNEIINNMATADVLFFGEEHNDSTAHQLEAIILEQLANKYPDQLALSMEMFETDCQTILNEYLRDLISEKHFKIDARVWPNYNDYSPLIEYAKSNMIPVLAANAPARYVNMVNRLGLNSLIHLDAAGKAYLPPLPIDTLTGPYLKKFDEIMGGHSAMPGMQMYQAQTLWDASMGYTIAKFVKQHRAFKVLQINGGFHSEGKLGAAAKLQNYDNQVRILNIAVYSDDSFDNPDWSKFATFGDYIIITDPKLPKTF